MTIAEARAIAARLEAETIATGRTIRLECKCGLVYHAIARATFYRCPSCKHVYDMLPKGHNPSGEWVDARAASPLYIQINSRIEDGFVLAQQEQPYADAR